MVRGEWCVVRSDETEDCKRRTCGVWRARSMDIRLRFDPRGGEKVKKWPPGNVQEVEAQRVAAGGHYFTFLGV